MAYTIPIPENGLHALLMQQLPPSVEDPEIGFAAGRVIVSGRLRKLGTTLRFTLEFEPSASGPDETANALDWRVRNVRPFLARWALKSVFRRRSSDVGFDARQGIGVRVGLDALLEELPAWRRLPAALRASLRLQHWWMPNDGRGVFLVFTRCGSVQAPMSPGPDSGPARRKTPVRGKPGESSAST